jgi:hypothetical protein
VAQLFSLGVLAHHMKSNKTKPSEIAMMILLGVPVLGILLGGVYWFPALRLTKERDPWFTLFLAAGLAVTVFGLGLLAHTPPLYSAAIWVLSGIFLLLRRAAYGGRLGHNVERFGMVHVAALLFTCFTAMFFHHVFRPHA